MENDIVRLVKQKPMSITDIQNQLGFKSRAQRVALEEECQKLVRLGILVYSSKKNVYSIEGQ
jgi:hypothetical protein